MSNNRTPNDFERKPGYRRYGSDAAGRPVFRCYDSNLAENSWYSFCALRSVNPDPGWEIARVGFNYYNGKPYKMNSRQVNRGVVTESEDTWEAISYETLSALIGSTITKDNYQAFIPDEKRHRIAVYEKKNLELGTIHKSRDACEYAGPIEIGSCFIALNQRFGCSRVYFRRTDTGYRACSITNSFHCPDTVPTEEEIDKAFECGVYDGSIYDHLLSAEESAYFHRELCRAEDDDGDSWNDVYGSSQIYVRIVYNNLTREFRTANCFFMRLKQLIFELSKHEIVFDQPSSSIEQEKKTNSNNEGLVEAPSNGSKTELPEEILDDISFIKRMKHIRGTWQQYDVLCAATGYGWNYMVDSAAYMEAVDLDDISTVTVADMANTPETELINAYRQSSGTLQSFDQLSVERGELAIGGISRVLRAPVKIVWFNQTNVLRFFTPIDDEQLLTRYIETVIRRTFGTKDAMKLAKPVPKIE